METSRRQLLRASASALATTVLARSALAQSFPFKPNQRYPDPSVEILDPSFAKYRIYSSTLEQLATGMRWAEGPAYFPEERYVLMSDIPRIEPMEPSDAALNALLDALEGHTPYRLRTSDQTLGEDKQIGPM